MFQNIVVFSLNSALPDECVVHGSALLRLYCALRGIAGIKYNLFNIKLWVSKNTNTKIIISDLMMMKFIYLCNW